MCEHGNETILDLPSHMCEWKENRTVCVDRCITKQILALWTAGYETLGCCCGHGKEKPSVVICEGYKDADIERISEILRKNDHRQWSILQWRLQKVATSQGE